MRLIIKLFLVLISMVTAILLWRILRPIQTPSAIKPINNTTTPLYTTKENEGGNVTVSVTPLRLTPGFPASFDVTFETHSVELSFGVENIATLTDLRGVSYTPHWEGSPPGGHHRTGTLRFTPDLSRPGSVILTLFDIAGVPQRTFTWEARKP